jgi:GTP-binding protein LepA
VIYKIKTSDGKDLSIENPAFLPDPTKILMIEEPFINATIHTPTEFIGGIMKLCEDKRGRQVKMEYVTEKKVMIVYQLPLNEVVLDFYDRLKTVSKGYASLDYEFSDFRESDMVKLDILINGDPVDALSLMVHKSKSQHRGRELTKKLKEAIPRQQFQVAIQAAIGSKIVARETISAMRKDVTAKCYGGDISRKRKLLEKQKEGKKRMKQIGTVDVPQEAFLAILKVED